MKVKTTELRIGNRLQEGIVHQVGFFNGYLGCHLLSSEFDSSAGVWHPEEYLHGIPLTEDEFKKLGFKVIESDILIYGKSYGKYYPEDDDYEHAFLVSQDANGNWYVSYNRKIIINTVHQLQNLWYEITRESL
jgi:hypothetical protein